MSFTVYISYSQKNKELVDKLYSVLKQNGIVTYALDVTIMPTLEGRPFADEIRRYINSSDYVFVLLTKDAITSPNIFFEIGLARASSKPILLIVEPDTGLPSEIGDLPYIILDRSNPSVTLEQIKQLSSKLKSQKEAGNAAMGLLFLLGALAFFAWLSSDER
ncbi:toll/interleukin-1 receptor domain-containing protein [Candidatus Bathyarchaeota archaeon]|nr:toll/interleukin-1 receptor domain-containing protein [Candidatus Bathyarchaeota archaeon]